MPGRVAARTTRASRTKAAESTVQVPDEGPQTTLRDAIIAIFSNVQRQNTGHRKLVVALRKIQEACCYESHSNGSKNAMQIGDFDEPEFNTEVSRCMLRILPIKKTEPVGDRVIRLLAMFLKHSMDLDNAVLAEYQQQQADHDMDEALETPSSRLGFRIISVLLPLLSAKDKVVRFRATQIIARLVNTLDYIDDELFQQIRLGMLKRLRDKESSVRVQAVYGLGRLASEGDAEQDDDGNNSDDETAGGVLERLIDCLQNDQSAEVRRSLLLNLPLTPATLPFLLERARDVDPALRRALYARILPGLGDFRHLSLTHREKLLRWGLSDRDDSVRKATAKLFRERWIEDCARPRDESGVPVPMQPGQVAEPSADGLLELLERIDVINAGNDGGVALDAMREFWDGRPDYRDFVTFDEEYWANLTPEGAFIVRSFNDFCRQDGAPDLLQDKIPEVTRLAYLIQSNVNVLVELVKRSATAEEHNDEDSISQEFIVEQLLHIALTLDYSDEIGRRTMFSLMREALALADLPEESTRLVVEVLRITCGQSVSAERDFCGIVLEAIAEVHDTIMGDDDEQPGDDDVDDSFHSARSDLSGESTPRRKKTPEVDRDTLVREIMVNMKCLHIAQCMLQNVDCELEDNAHLVTMLNNLVVPAVKSVEAPIRERGFLCLGLCCLLDKNLAEQNLPLFLHCYQKGHPELQNIAIQVVGDILVAHPAILLVQVPSDGDGHAAPEEHPLHKPIHRMFQKALKSAEPGLQSTACISLCKLMLSAPAIHLSSAATILNTEELLRLLVVAYFDPESTANPALRQALSYFIPVYCHSRRENQQRMGRISLAILNWCISVKEEMDVDADDEGSGEMVGMTVVISHLVDWTDGRKLAAATRSGADADADDADCDVHLDVAAEILEKVMGVCSKDERKLYISMLGKLTVTASSAQDKLQTVSDLIQEAIEDKVANDAPTRNTLAKVESAIAKALVVADTKSPQKSPAKRGERASVAPLAGDDEGDDENPVHITRPAARQLQLTALTLGTGDVDDMTSTATPMASPRKRMASRRTPATVSRRDAASVDLDGSDMAALSINTPSRRARKGASSYAEPDGSIIDEEDEEEESILMSPQISPRLSPQKKNTVSEVQRAPSPSVGDETDKSLLESHPIPAAPIFAATKVKLEPLPEEGDDITTIMPSSTATSTSLPLPHRPASARSKQPAAEPEPPAPVSGPESVPEPPAAPAPSTRAGSTRAPAQRRSVRASRRSMAAAGSDD